MKKSRSEAKCLHRVHMGLLTSVTFIFQLRLPRLHCCGTMSPNLLKQSVQNKPISTRFLLTVCQYFRWISLNCDNLMHSSLSTCLGPIKKHGALIVLSCEHMITLSAPQWKQLFAFKNLASFHVVLHSHYSEKLRIFGKKKFSLICANGQSEMTRQGLMKPTFALVFLKCTEGLKGKILFITLQMEIRETVPSSSVVWLQNMPNKASKFPYTDL